MKVLVEGIDQAICVLLQHPPELLQLPFAPFDCFRPTCSKGSVERGMTIVKL